MVSVQIDGQPLGIDISGAKTMGELVELVKSQIDPDSVVESLTIEGRQLTDSDWRAPLNVQGSSVLEVTTSSREAFVASRLEQAPEFVRLITESFAKARQAFQQGDQTVGNNLLNSSVNDLKAFFQWYDIVLEAGAISDADKARIVGNVQELAQTCEQLVQQQLYNSWWALGESLESKLEPQLNELCQSCESFAQSRS